MSEISRKCVPFTPLTIDLKDAIIGLVSSAGVHLKSGAAFNVEGDTSFRILPHDVKTEELMVTHDHYDHTDADKDINCVFPIDILRELAEEGFIKGTGNKHIGFMGFSMRLKDMYEITAPAIAKEVERSNIDAVLLTAG